MTQCIVKGCESRAPSNDQLCQRCEVMLSRGLLMSSGAWFAVELDFLNQQNYHAVEQIRLLNDKVSHLIGENK